MPHAHNWDIFRFKERYYERVWGGRKLKALYGKPLPDKVPVGEAWLISDHPGNESVIDGGPWEGQTLQTLLAADARALLGANARTTPAGRFPLLLKLLDAAENLSVQVHPDDACAERLREPDVGKTEMWYVLQTEPESELICGLKPGVEREAFRRAVASGDIERLLHRFPVHPGASVFVSAGTVHAVGAGVVLAEIQQNSDLTYRIHDWGRVGSDGQPRTLHLEKALEAIDFSAAPAEREAVSPPGPSDPDSPRTLLASSSHFAAEQVVCAGTYARQTRGESFHILLAISGSLAVNAGFETHSLAPGEALLVPGLHQQYFVEGRGEFLDYYVPGAGPVL